MMMMPAIMCLNPERTDRELRALLSYLEDRATELAATEMEFMRLSNVSSERFLSDFRDAVDRFFGSRFRQTIPSAINLVHVGQELFGTTPPPPPMRPSADVCRDAARILTDLREIERLLRRMDVIFDQMNRAYLTTRQQLASALGGLVLPRPADDPGRGSRMLSAFEQVAFATVGALRDEVAATIPLVRDALGQVSNVLLPFLVRFAMMSRPMGSMSM